MNKLNPLSFSLPTSLPSSASNPDLTKETLVAAANRDDAAMKELLRGTGERVAQVDRVRLALGVLQSELGEAKKEEKARIARAARELMDEHLPAVKEELKKGTNVALSELEKKIEEARATAVLEERSTLNTLSYEAVSFDANEIARTLKDGDWKTWAMYAGVAAGAGFAAKWLWDHSFGWLWKKAEGSKEKPGFLRRAAGWLATGAGVAAGAVGFHYWKMNGGKFSATGNAAVDVPTGMANVVGKDVMKIAGLLQMDAELVYELFASENWEKVWDILSSKGVNVVYQHGQVALEFLGDMVVMPAEFGKKLWTRMTTGKWDKDTWMVYGQAGAAYVIGKGTLNALLRGKVTLPLTIKDGAITVFQMGAWPADMANDVFQAGRTGITAGGRGLLFRYVAPTWPSRLANYGADIIFRPDCGTTKGIESALRYWKQIEADCDMMDEASWLFEEKVMKVTAKRRKEIAAALQKSLKEATIADDAPQYIKDLKKQVDLGLKAFEAEMDKAVLAGRLAPTAEAADDLAKAAKAAGAGADAAEATTDAAKAGKAGAGAIDETAKATEEGIEATTDAAKTGKAAATTAEGTEAGADAVKGARAAAQTGAATEAATDAIETGDEWVRAAAQARKALLAENATEQAVQAVNDSVLKCKALGLGADDAVKALKDPNVLLALTRTPANQVKSLAVAIEGGNAAANMSRMCTFIAKFADHLDDAAKATILLDKSLLRTVMNSGLDATDIADILKNPAIRSALLEGKNVEKIMADLIWWKNATSLHTIINVGGAIVSAAMLVNDIVTLVERRNQLTEAINNLGADLQKAGYKKEGTDYVHPTTKKRICMSVVESNIDNMSNPQWLRVAGSGVGTLCAIGTLAFPAMAVNPLVGLAILGVEITIQGAAAVWDDENVRQFMLTTPTSVLSVVDLNKIIQKDSKAVLDDASSWMWSDYHPNHWFTGDQNKKQKDMLRKKAVSVMFFQELQSMAKESPEVAAQILKPRYLSDTQDANKPLDAGSFLDEDNGAFWIEDYERIIKPFLAARLFQMSKDDSVKWSQFRELKIDEGTFDFENIAPADMRLALRETAHVYAQYLKQKDYIDQKKKVKSNEALEVDEKVLGVQSFKIRAERSQQVEQGKKDLLTYGNQAVFGKKISELDDGSGVTAVERYLQDLTKRLDSRAGVTTKEVADQRASWGDGSGLETLARVSAVPMAGVLPLVAPSPYDTAFGQGDERSVMGKKEIFTGKNPGAAGNVRLEDAAGISGREAERQLTEAEVLAVIAKGRDLYDGLEGVGTWGKTNSVWYAQPSHFKQLKEYSYVLQRTPNFAKEPSVASFLASVKHLGEGFSWEDGYMGSEFLAQRNDAFRESLSALRAMTRSLDARTYHIAKVERGSAYTHVLTLPGQKTKLFTNFEKDAAPDMRGDPSVLYVEHDSKTLALSPKTAGETFTEIVPGCGTFTCEMQTYMAKGKPAYRYRWSFERAPDAKRGGSELYAYFKSDGAEQPGTKISLPEMKYYKKVMNTELPLVLDDPSTLYTDSRLTITYRDKEGKVVKATGWFTEIIHNHPIGWRGLRNTDPKTKEQSTWTRFFPKDGATLIGCTVEYRNKPMTVEYAWKPQQPAPLATDKPAPAKKVNRAA